MDLRSNESAAAAPSAGSAELLRVWQQDEEAAGRIAALLSTDGLLDSPEAQGGEGAVLGSRIAAFDADESVPRLVAAALARARAARGGVPGAGSARRQPLAGEGEAVRRRLLEEVFVAGEEGGVAWGDEATLVAMDQLALLEEERQGHVVAMAGVAGPRGRHPEDGAGHRADVAGSVADRVRQLDEEARRLYRAVYLGTRISSITHQMDFLRRPGDVAHPAAHQRDFSAPFVLALLNALLPPYAPGGAGSVSRAEVLDLRSRMFVWLMTNAQATAGHCRRLRAELLARVRVVGGWEGAVRPALERYLVVVDQIRRLRGEAEEETRGRPEPTSSLSSSASAAANSSSGRPWPKPILKKPAPEETTTKRTVVVHPAARDWGLSEEELLARGLAVVEAPAPAAPATAFPAADRGALDSSSVYSSQASLPKSQSGEEVVVEALVPAPLRQAVETARARRPSGPSGVVGGVAGGAGPLAAVRSAWRSAENLRAAFRGKAPKSVRFTEDEVVVAPRLGAADDDWESVRKGQLQKAQGQAQTTSRQEESSGGGGVRVDVEIKQEVETTSPGGTTKTTTTTTAKTSPADDLVRDLREIVDRTAREFFVRESRTVADLAPSPPPPPIPARSLLRLRRATDAATTSSPPAGPPLGPPLLPGVSSPSDESSSPRRHIPPVPTVVPRFVVAPWEEFEPPASASAPPPLGLTTTITAGSDGLARARGQYSHATFPRAAASRPSIHDLFEPPQSLALVRTSPSRGELILHPSTARHQQQPSPASPSSPGWPSYEGSSTSDGRSAARDEPRLPPPSSLTDFERVIPPMLADMLLSSEVAKDRRQKRDRWFKQQAMEELGLEEDKEDDVVNEPTMADEMALESQVEKAPSTQEEPKPQGQEAKQEEEQQEKKEQDKEQDKAPAQEEEQEAREEHEQGPSTITKAWNSLRKGSSRLNLKTSVANIRKVFEAPPSFPQPPRGFSANVTPPLPPERPAPRQPPRVRRWSPEPQAPPADDDKAKADPPKKIIKLDPVPAPVPVPVVPMVRKSEESTSNSYIRSGRQIEALPRKLDHQQARELFGSRPPPKKNRSMSNLMGSYVAGADATIPSSMAGTTNPPSFAPAGMTTAAPPSAATTNPPSFAPPARPGTTPPGRGRGVSFVAPVPPVPPIPARFSRQGPALPQHAPPRPSQDNNNPRGNGTLPWGFPMPPTGDTRRAPLPPLRTSPSVPLALARAQALYGPPPTPPPNRPLPPVPAQARQQRSPLSQVSQVSQQQRLRSTTTATTAPRTSQAQPPSQTQTQLPIPTPTPIHGRTRDLIISESPQHERSSSEGPDHGSPSERARQRRDDKRRGGRDSKD